MKNTNTHQINETHLGTEASAEQAQQMAEILTAMGHPTEYTSTSGGSSAITDEGGEEIQIPDSVWFSALNKIS